MTKDVKSEVDTSQENNVEDGGELIQLEPVLCCGVLCK